MKQKGTFSRHSVLAELPLLAVMAAIPAAALGGDYLYGGTQLNIGQSIRSAQGKYSLVMQADGNLVMYRNDGTVRYRLGSTGWFAAMQTDGNFVEYSGMMAPVFNTETSGHPGALLHIQDDGNLVVYSKTFAPLWNIGAEPDWKDPKQPADVVGRNLDVAVGGELGHVGVYDGQGNVIEADGGFANAIRILTLNQFKSTTHNFWGTSSANIPSGSSVKGCYQRYCYSDADFQQFEMRVAVARVAYAANLIGASYSFLAELSEPRWGNSYTAPVRGLFRCDTFVLWALSAPA